MAMRRTFEVTRTQASLDYEIESKVGTLGPFTPNEMMVVFLAPILMTAVVALLLAPFIKMWGVLSLVPNSYIVPKIVTRLKKNKPRSWMFDLLHRYGLPTFTAQYHFRRAFSKRSWTGLRRLVGGPWVKAKNASLVPTKPWHLTYGMPALRVWNPHKERFDRSLTPQPRIGDYAILDRRYRPGSMRIPDYRRNAVLAREADGHCILQDFKPTLTRWRFVQ